MATLSIPLAQIQIFLLVFLRVSVIMVTLPLFDNRSIPPIFKVGLSLAVTLVLIPVLEIETFPVVSAVVPFVLGAVTEVVLALAIGLSVRLLFTGIQLAGQVAGMQMGFAMVNVVDPLTGTSEAITAHFLYMCTMLTFLSLNGPLHLLKGLSASFELVPPGGLMLTPELVGQVFAFSNELFILAIKIAAPVMVALFLVDLSLALIARAAPQMHVLVLGFPIKISVGFFFLGFLFTIMADYIGDFIGGMGGLFREILKAAHPG